MSSVTAAPWRQTDGAGVIEGSRWRIIRDGDNPELGESLDDWDPGLDLQVVRDVEIRVDAVRRACGMPPETSLLLAAAWHSEGSTMRGAGTREQLPATGTHTTRLTLRAPGTELAGSITFTTTIVLGEPIPTAPVRARLPGSILYEDTARLVLEGGASRFPMEPVSFASSSYHLPSHAAWALDWDPEDLELPVLGGLRLLLNTDHDAISGALDSPSEPGSKVLVAAMMADVGRQMVMGALANDEFLQREDWPKGSVARIVRRLLNSRFGGESPRSLREKWTQDPQRFEAMVQDALRAYRLQGGA